MLTVGRISSDKSEGCSVDAGGWYEEWRRRWSGRKWW